MSEKKVVSRNIAIVLGIVCIILTVSLVGAVANYTLKINDLNSQIQKLQTLLSVYNNPQTENAINYLSNFMFISSVGLDKEIEENYRRSIKSPKSSQLMREHDCPYSAFSFSHIN